MERTKRGWSWQPPEGWGILLLTLALVLVGSITAANAGWTPGLSIMQSVAVISFFIGLMIARSRLPALVCHAFGLVIGLAWSFRLVAGLFPPGYSWTTRWNWLWYRIYRWGQSLLSTGRGDDNLVFVLQMALIIWLMTYLVTWFVFRRHQVWPALLVSGGTVLVILYYAPNDLSIYLALYLILALLLLMRFHLYMRQQRWRQRAVLFNAGDITFDFWRAGLVASLLLVALAWLVPTTIIARQVRALDVVRGPVADVEYLWSRWFGSLTYRPSPGVDFSSQSLSLGGPRSLPETPVLEVTAPGYVRYRRMVTYDVYDGRTWENSDPTVTLFGGDYPSPAQLSYLARRPVTFTVTALVANSSVMVTAGQPTWVSRPARATLDTLPAPAEIVPDHTTVTGISFVRSRIPFRAGDSYQVAARVSRATVEQLQATRRAYPQWVSDRYLQLPDSLPQRVKDLAAELVSQADNPYDQAGAIEAYLRSHITYNEGISAPPPGRDPSDYILFDLKEAYCDYYATAMVVMLRSVGIPARLAAGYSQGDYRYEDGSYQVSLDNAHSWVEVFFPGYGWIEFEPTAAQPAISRPSQAAAGGATQGDSLAGTEDSTGGDKPSQLERVQEIRLGDDGPWWLALLPGGRGLGWCLLLPLVALLAVLAWQGRRWRGAGLLPVETVYHRLSLLSGWAGLPEYAWQTPHERALALAQALPAAGSDALRIAEIFTTHRYARRRITLSDSADLKEAWQRLRPQLVRAVLRHSGRRLVGWLLKPFQRRTSERRVST